MKRYEGHLGPWQGVTLVTVTLASMLYLQFPQFLIHMGGPAAWQVALVMTLVAVLIFLPGAALAAKFPGLGLAEIAEAAAGPLLGPALMFGVSGWLIASTALTLRNFTETFSTAMLPDTPPSILVLTLLGCIAFASYRGLEALSRSTQILYPLILGSGLLVIILTLPQMGIYLLYPFWGHGLGTTLTSGVAAAGMAGEAIILLIFGYAFRSAGDLRTGLIGGILSFGLLMALVVAVLVMVFGSPDAAQLPFPVFNLARLIFLGLFLQRMEALIVLFWFFGAAIRLSACLHASVVALSGALRLPFYRPVIFPVVVLVGSLTLMPPDFITTLQLEERWMRPAGLLIAVVPTLLLLLAVVRRKGGDGRVA